MNKMKDLSDREPITSGRTIIILALLVLLAGLVIILFMFAGGASVDADTPIYVDGKLMTTISNSGDSQKTWVQYNIYRQGGLSSEQVGETYSYITELQKGNTLSTCDVTLSPGTYKVFIYISSCEENPVRIAGFIKDIEVK
ncbi:MAG TPA: hypothetical protein O0X25_00695 [Methanocorpusculum sp.]|nr:hypothetical protein [Methanocorpusculum sp.]HJJ49124.1 hypothetical protein [Methanocorpusculum sp.]